MAYLRWSLTLLALLAIQGACRNRGSADPGQRWVARREALVRHQIKARGIKDARVLAAMRKVPRHLFVPPSLRARAYGDYPLPIGKRQTISQPYIVALMSEALQLKPGARVLEIGTGSGYQAAVLGELAKEVYSVEIIPALGQRSARLLRKLGYRNVHVRVGDGYQGWPAKAPFDAVILTAAPHRIPAPLLSQLKQPGGVLVAPVGPARDQRLIRVTRTAKGFKREHLLDVRFVPMTGKALKSR